MKQITIYLAGQISIKAKETYEWRKRVRTSLSDDRRFHIIDPTFNDFNLGALEEKGLDQHKDLFRRASVNFVVPKDRNSVKRSDICIVNLNTYDPNKPFIGTLFELAWYYDSPEKTVIGIIEEEQGDSIISAHPFITEAVNIWVKNELDAIALVQKFTERIGPSRANLNGGNGNGKRPSF